MISKSLSETISGIKLCSYAAGSPFIEEVTSLPTEASQLRQVKYRIPITAFWYLKNIRIQFFSKENCLCMVATSVIPTLRALRNQLPIRSVGSKSLRWSVSLICWNSKLLFCHSERSKAESKNLGIVCRMLCLTVQHDKTIDTAGYMNWWMCLLPAVTFVVDI